MQVSNSEYRSDITGLRAIAILLVVFYHAFPDFLFGGFIGVDIFFVVSGYLISSIIFRDLKRGSFSFSEFYGRRVGRIFPSLLLVLCACLAFGWFVLSDDEYKQLGTHLAGSAAFASNFLLWSQTGYFDHYSETKPLLHLWSLGIEEQFYIVWPVIIWLCWRAKWNLWPIIVLLLFASFLANLAIGSRDADAAFYLPHTRFWELLLGALVAYLSIFRDGLTTAFLQWGGKSLANTTAAFGLVLICLGAATINKNSVYPGWLALLPTIGTVMLISAGENAWANKNLLSNRFLKCIGLLSYPLYLWHWPLLSFAKIYYQGDGTLSLQVRIIVISTAILLAWFCYSVIEKPFRHSRRKSVCSLDRTHWLLIVAMVSIGLVGAAFDQWKGEIVRTGALLRPVWNSGDTGDRVFEETMEKNYFRCKPDLIYDTSTMWEDRIVRCRQSKKDTLPTFALIGDSHAEHLFIGLSDSLLNHNVAYYTRNGFPYLSNTAYDSIFREVIGSTELKVVVFSSYWIFNGYVDFKELDNSVRAVVASQKQVFLAEDVPDFVLSAIKCKYSEWSSHNNCTESAAQIAQRHAAASAILQQVIANNPTVKLLKIRRYFCSDVTCTMAKDGKLLFRDGNHLNINGSRYLAERLVADNPGLAN